MVYYSSLDGFRAVAVAIVLLAHANVPYTRSGWAGVDAFFTLSGFLITSILLAEQDVYGCIHIKHFYARRCLRLLPCLWLTVVAVFIVWALMGRAAEIVHDVAFATTYTMNWARAFEWSHVGPLEHTWTLAIEEQFYLIWPLFIVFACRNTKDRLAQGMWFSAAALGVALYRLDIIESVSSNRIHYGLDTHADPMLIGAALACFHSSRNGRRLGEAWSHLVGYVLAACRANYPGDSNLLGLVEGTPSADSWIFHRFRMHCPHFTRCDNRIAKHCAYPVGISCFSLGRTNFLWNLSLAFPCFFFAFRFWHS